MKRFILTAIAAIMCFAANAQNEVAYCEIVGIQKLLSNKVTVQIDYGQKNRAFSDQRMVGPDGKPMSFNSMMDALNYMCATGWQYVDAYALGSDGTYIYHYVLKYIGDGNVDEQITTKAEANAEKRK